MKNKYLPIGTIVILNKNNQKIMITGYFCSNEKQLYDYSGCFYPEGIVNSKNEILFNNMDIKKISHMGYVDESYDSFSKKLIKISKQYIDVLTKVSYRMFYKLIKDSGNNE